MESKFAKVTNVLLDHGANASITDNNGNNPLSSLMAMNESNVELDKDQDYVDTVKAMLDHLQPEESKEFLGTRDPATGKHLSSNYLANISLGFDLFNRASLMRDKKFITHPIVEGIMNHKERHVLLSIFAMYGIYCMIVIVAWMIGAYEVSFAYYAKNAVNDNFVSITI
jgi:hypothetical protein